MSRSREFGPNIFQRLEQGSQARDGMIRAAIAASTSVVVTDPIAAVSNKSMHPAARLLLVGLTLGMGFASSRPSIVEAATPVPVGKPRSTDTPTPTPTRTPTPTETRTPTPIVVTATPTIDMQATVVAILTKVAGTPTPTPTETRIPTPTATPTLTPIPTETRIPTSTPTPIVVTATPTPNALAGAEAIFGQVDALKKFGKKVNDLFDDCNDKLRTCPAAAPTPVLPTPTPDSWDQAILDAQTEARNAGKDLTAAQLEDRAKKLQQRANDLRNPTPTPNATETRIARATAGAQEIIDRQKTATAEVPPAIASAKREADRLAKEEEAAQLERENQRTEERIRALRGQVTPVAGPVRPSTNEGFPWVPAIIATTILGAIYLLRTRIPVVRRVGVRIPGPRI